jgi:molybdenum-dependent DNA-binding transcriptional regulator ModE
MIVFVHRWSELCVVAQKRGEPKLTECGERVLQLYREMEDKSLEAIQSRWKNHSAIAHYS